MQLERRYVGVSCGDVQGRVAIIKTLWRGCRDGSVVRNTGSSCRGPSFNSKTHTEAHNYLLRPVPGDLTSSSGLKGYCMHMIHRYRQAGT